MKTALRIALALALAAGTSLCWGQEGYDPMRIISAQIARPSIYIVMDRSGSMVWDINGESVGVDSTGNWPTASWRVQGSGTSSAGKYKTWIATLTVSQTLPSRMATVKNALGNTVSIIVAYEPPATSSFPAAGTFPAAWRQGTITGPTYTYTTGTTTTWKWAWKVVYSTYKTSPGNPFTATQTIGTNTTAPLYGTYPAQLPPGDLLGQTKDSVNWGLYTYSTNGYTLEAAIDSNDTGDVTTLENKMKLNSAGGLSAGGSTPTKTALTNVKTQLQNTFNADPKYNCGRTYATILVTDGLSNSGNPNNKNWISPCGACPGPSCCDVGSSGYNCPNNYTAFPAGSSESLWNSAFSRGGVTYRLPIRTWVIGVSDAVGPCELNFTAYMGRTDANAPNGDAGFALNSSYPYPTAPNAVIPLDPYLPQATGDTTNYQTTHGNYAYFATSAQALKAAFEAIVAALGPGDYTTSQPIVSSATGLGGDVSLLASAEYPGWKGHLYAFKLSDGTLLWDAGEKLSTTDANARRIYTYDGSYDLVPVNAANAAAINSLCGNCGFTATVADWVRGVGRTWKLGAIINSTPTIVAGALQWEASGAVPEHQSFEAAYGNRHPVIYAGSSDGLLHVFDAVDGQEIMAILTAPNIAKQVTFYNNYTTSPTRYPTGEPGLPPSHIYGVANSPRVGDVYFGSPDREYRTVLYLTEGPSSKNLIAMDVSHPYPGRTGVVLPDGSSRDYAADPTYDPTAPVNILWQKSHSDYLQLESTWSIPAVAATQSSVTNPAYEANIGGGFNSASTRTSPVAPSLLSLDAGNGSSNDIVTLTNLTTPAPIVGNQAFADTVMFNLTQRIYQEGTYQNVAVQADENGQIWFLARPTGSSPVRVVNASAHAGQAQPIYYSPSVAGFKNKMCLAFASGTFYEKSGQVTGATSAFLSRFYLVAKDQDMSPINDTSSSQIKSWRLTDLDNFAGGTLSDRAMPASQSLMLVPQSDSGTAVALFSAYDPASGDCAGTSYVYKVEFDPASLASATITGSVVGSGAISGFSVSKDAVIVAKSGVGTGSRASTQVVPGVSVGGSASGLKPVWWRELQ